MDYTLYSFVLQHLDPFQKGIQTAHAITEYANSYSKTNEYMRWANVNKEISVHDVENYQKMMEIMESFQKMGLKYEYFEDKELNRIVTSIVVIIEDDLWDLKNDDKNYEKIREILDSCV